MGRLGQRVKHVLSFILKNSVLKQFWNFQENTYGRAFPCKVVAFMLLKKYSATVNFGRVSYKWSEKPFCRTSIGNGFSEYLQA